ncbi:MAG: CRISPR-associated endonuclease Cas3'', partial [Eubacterium sp.]|nr:CRISPR-associated endonuclease Cas3'' [Eubacterium sp.]
MRDSCFPVDTKLPTGSPPLHWLPAKASPGGELWLPCWMHSKDTAEIAVLLLEEWLPGHIADFGGVTESDLRNVCRFLGLVHDFGKLTPVFAARITEVIPEIRQKLEAKGFCIGTPGEYADSSRTPHARAGEELLLDMGCTDCVASVVGAHHGKPQDSVLRYRDELSNYEKNYYGPDYKDSRSGQLWKSARSEWLSYALAESGFPSVDALPILRQPIQIVLTGLLIMADWIASNTSYFPLIPLDSCGRLSLYPERVRCAWERLDLPSAWEPMTFVMDHGRFCEVFPFAPNPVQDLMLRAVNESRGGLFILEAQMGVGKTEAALAAAEVLASKCRCGGIYFGLPTQATANALFARLTEWAGEQAEGTRLAIRLAHGMAELNEEYRAFFRGASNVNDDGEKDDRLIVHPWFSGHKQALLANYVIGTVDQLLLSALKQKHVFLRHLGLSGKVVILDECHAYDAYMNQY